mmetsp:Transcript_44763/g.138573  ORF Transcript_44763/g.138573 Transcript_44763/m.138573 type:complete len:211 (-) Transcript_44763:824-1456(-)
MSTGIGSSCSSSASTTTTTCGPWRCATLTAGGGSSCTFGRSTTTWTDDAACVAPCRSFCGPASGSTTATVTPQVTMETWGRWTMRMDILGPRAHRPLVRRGEGGATGAALNSRTTARSSSGRMAERCRSFALMTAISCGRLTQGRPSGATSTGWRTSGTGSSSASTTASRPGSTGSTTPTSHRCSYLSQGGRRPWRRSGVRWSCWCTAGG